MSATVSTFSRGGSTTTVVGEITRELVNSTDGQGLHFDGAAGTYVDCSDTTILDGATKISLEAIASTSGTSMGTFIAKSSAADGINLRFNADGKIFCALNNSSSTVSATTSGTYNDGNPKHIVATWDNATISIYVNGNLDGTATLAGGSIPNTTDRLALGANLNSGGTSSNNFDGIIYRARLWNKSLSSAEVTATYENATVPFADQYGSQTIVIPGDFTGNLDGWNTSNTWTSQTNPSNNMVLAGSGSGSAVQNCRTATTLITGKKYRCTYTASSITGTPRFADYTTDYNTLSNIESGTNSFDFELTSAANAKFYIASTANTDAVTLDDVSVVEIGCVSDYDLAFANPTQSLMVQDRAGAADGTSSATGVVQVTPIEQLNSKSARIGTSAATPADGEVFADAVVVGDGTANQNWVRVHSTASQIAGVKMFRGAGDSSDASNNNFGLLVTDSGCEISKFTDGGANITGRVPFLTISSTGDVTLGAGALRTLKLDGAAYGFQQRLQLKNSGADFSVGVSTGNAGGNDFFIHDGNAAANRLTISSVGNVGVGVSPESWHSSYTALQFAGNGALSGWGNQQAGAAVFLSQNSYLDPTAWKYISTDEASRYEQVNGTHTFSVATSGTADAAITWTDALTISSAGHLSATSNDSSAQLTLTPTGTNASSIINFVPPGTGSAKLQVGGTAALILKDGGVYEPNGVLKSNLLSNSGFDVWSNSTLVEATSGAAPVTDGANSALTNNKLTNGGFDSDASSWSGLDATLASVTGGKTGNCLQVTRTGAGFNYAQQDGTALVVGKLYQLSAYVKSGSSGDEAFQIYSHGSQGYGNGITGTSSSLSWVLYTTVFEATTTSATMIVGKQSATAGTMLFDTVCLYEVTPGIVTGGTGPDGWYKNSGIDISREHNGSNTKDGSFYALKAEPAAQNDFFGWPTVALLDNAEWYQRFAGRTVTFGAWVKTSTSSDVRLAIADGTATTRSDYQSSAGNFQWLEVTQTVSASPTKFEVWIEAAAASPGEFFVSQPMLVFGSAIGAGNYSRPSGEVIWFEKTVISTAVYSTGFSDVAATTLNAEADSNGAIPKGVKAITAQLSARDSGSATTASYFYTHADATSTVAPIAYPYGKANDTYDYGNGDIPCDANGDFKYALEASGSGTLDAFLVYYGVQLR